MIKHIVFWLVLGALLTETAQACKKTPPEPKNTEGLGPAPTAPKEGGDKGRGAKSEKPEMDAESQAYAACVAKQCKSGSMLCQEQCVRDPDGASWENIQQANTTDSVVFDDRPK